MAKEVTTWRELVHPLVRKLRIAGKFGGRATWDGEGAAAFADLLQKMAEIIDQEVLIRAQQRGEVQEEGRVEAERVHRIIVREILRQQGDTSPEFKWVAKLYRAHKKGK